MVEENQSLLPIRIYRTATRFFGATRGLFLPFGIAGLLAMGVHLASDITVDAMFISLGVLDRIAEAIVGTVLDWLQATGIPNDGWANRLSFAFADWIDVETREAWARIGGVILELYVDVIMFRAAMSYDEIVRLPILFDDTTTRIDRIRLTISRRFVRKRRALNEYFADTIIYKVYLPIASLCAVVAGTYAIGLAVENFLFAHLVSVPWAAENPYWAAVFPAYCVMAIIVWRMGWPMFAHSWSYAESRNQAWHEGGMLPLRRRLRGLISGLIVLPLMIAAVLIGTPIGQWLGVG